MAVVFGYSQQFGNLKEHVNGIVRKMWLLLIGVGIILHSIILDIIQYSWYDVSYNKFIDIGRRLIQIIQWIFFIKNYVKDF